MLTAEQKDNRLTNSSMTTARVCLRRYYYSTTLGLRPEADSKPLRFGRGFHLALELRANGKSMEETVVAVLGEYDKTPFIRQETGEFDPDWLIERETLARLISGYYWMWDRQEIIATPLAVEMPFEIPLINPETGAASKTFVLAGKMDMIAELVDGRIAVVEHKTNSEDLSPESDYWARLRMDAQISLYYHAAKQMGYDVQTVVYDVTRKPTIGPLSIPILDDAGFKIVLDAEGKRVYLDNGKPRQSSDAAKGWTLQSRRQTDEEYGRRLTDDITERPDWYFARREIPRLDADLKEARYDIWQTAGILRDCQRWNRWPRTPSACMTYNTRCPYFDLCANGWNAETDPVPSGLVRVDDVHPELVKED